MATLRIEKLLSALPGTLTPDTLYFIKNTDGTVETFITDASGTEAFNTSNNEDQLDPFLLMGLN